jgi:WS/DGAT/MGAT family acyltransferase
LREFLAKRGELPDASLQASVPVSTHGEGEGKGVNQISSMFVSLATDIPDPVERLRAVHEMTANAKEEHKAVGARLLQEWAEFAAPLTFGLAARLIANPAVAERITPSNLVISNVPGPQFPLYFAGAEMRRFYPLGPLTGSMGLNLTVLSLRDNVGFGFIACRELLSAAELQDLASLVPMAVAELRDTAHLLD